MNGMQHQSHLGNGCDVTVLLGNTAVLYYKCSVTSSKFYPQNEYLPVKHTLLHLHGALCDVTALLGYVATLLCYKSNVANKTMTIHK